ncbi:mRNA capping enzyme [Panus rudis PR-1116 ss-1]|nr:mRNA capping enzyme [Panus rudis PR-1116 ss-1]
MPRIPDLPGNPVPHRSDHEYWLKQTVARICQLDHERFPGAQPVSFGKKDLERLENQDFWVAEKSDGIRVLLFINTDLQTNNQDVYLIDRHNSYRQLTGLYFPHWEHPTMPLRNTLVDGELVIDVDPVTKQEKLRFLAFDCLVVDDQNIMSKTIESRYGRLQAWFYKPVVKMLREFPHMAQTLPFEIKVKDVKPSYHVNDVFNIDIPALQHGNDGLIYTSATTPYIPGTDQNILKWKPPSENTIDFKLVLRFPARPAQPNEPDYFAKPVFELHVFCGDRGGQAQYEFYDVLRVEDDEWERLKESGEQLDDRVVEVHWDLENECWRMMRFRDDKPYGNHKSVVEAIIKSIADGVEKEEILARSDAIRNAWKARQASQLPKGRPGQAPPPQTHLLPPKPQSGVPVVKARYGPLAPSPWSKVSGPAVFAGMHR